MDIALLVLAAASLLAAAGFGIAAWRVLAEQRRRSAARVAMLAAALEGEAADTSAIGSAIRRAADAEPPVPIAPRAIAAVPVSSMFGTAPGGAVRGRPIIKGAVAAAMAVTLIVVAMANRTHTETSPASGQTAPLELMSMRHTRDGSTFTVTGLVRNPSAGARRERIAAVVLVFGRDGAFALSGRAPLDFTALAPGDESPFVVMVPNAGDVSRYRLSFRTDASVVRHVDRRITQDAGGPAGDSAPRAALASARVSD